MNTFLSKSKTFGKTCFLVGDLNLNLIDYQSDAKVRDFVNLIFQYSLVPTVNKPSRVTKNNATLIDYIISNSINDQENLTGILKTDIFWSFSNFYYFYETDLILAIKKVTIRERERERVREREWQMQARFKNSDILFEVDCGNLYSISNPNDGYKYFLKVFLGLYLAFLSKLSGLKEKLKNPWMTKGLLKSSKQKQKLYKKFMKKVHEMKTLITHINPSLKVWRKSLKKLLHKTSGKISKRYKEIVGCNQGDYRESKIN